MSAGSNQLDCQQAAARLHELIDGELTPEVEEAVRQHLEDCADCMSVFEFEQAFQRFVALRGRSSHAPEDLRSRILSGLHPEEPSPDA